MVGKQSIVSPKRIELKAKIVILDKQKSINKKQNGPRAHTRLITN